MEKLVAALVLRLVPGEPMVRYRAEAKFMTARPRSCAAAAAIATTWTVSAPALGANVAGTGRAE